VRLSWRPDDRSFADVTHETLDHTTRARYTRYGGDGVGSWSTDVSVENSAGQGELSASGALSYTGNRARLTVSHHATGDALYGLRSSSIDGTIRENRTSVLAETAVAFAGGRVAVGRPVTNSFAIVDTHETLSGRRAEVGRGGGRVEARSDGLGPLLVPDVSAYTTTRLQYDVADLPPGYDLGTGAFDLAPPHRAGYSLEVGSAYTVTAFGTLIGTDGTPVALVTGVARPAHGPAARAVEVFTNRAGRFSAQGLAPGRWTIEMRSGAGDSFVVDVPRGAVGLYDAGTLQAVQK
jgi:outer membrane usher protein